MCFFGETVDRWVLLGSTITIMSGVIIIWRERVVSKVQGNLKTRNSGMVGAAMIESIESETRDAEHLFRKEDALVASIHFNI
jgi:hypothetical protein